MIQKCFLTLKTIGYVRKHPLYPTVKQPSVFSQRLLPNHLLLHRLLQEIPPAVNNSAETCLTSDAPIHFF